MGGILGVIFFECLPFINMKTRFPVEIRHNGVIAKIQRADKIYKGKRLESFIIIYSEKGRRKRQRRSSLEAAHIAAKNVCSKISSGEHLTLELKNAERLEYTRAIDSLAPLGVKLDIATHEYANAMRLLPKGVRLPDVVDYFCRRNPEQETRTIKEVVADMLKAKESAGLSEAYQHDLDTRLNRFSGDFKMNISDVSGAKLQIWIDALKVQGNSKNASGRSKQNYLRAIAELFRFAIRRKWLPKDAMEEIEAVQLPKEDSMEIEIFTPGEMGEILSVARPEMVPFLAIAGFAGLRSAELARLDWSEINLAERFIEIKASKAKTAARRLAAVTDNLASWIQSCQEKEGSIVNIVTWWNEFPKIARAVNEQRKRKGEQGTFVWRHNALRHSFCSYRLAAIKDAARVALEAGNSPQMIFKHYRQVVTDTEAAKWFSIVPNEPVIQKLAA
jgi:integrase